MKPRYTSLLRLETILIACIILAFSLTWISWGKLIVTGWELPSLYKKSTSISNTIMFFSKKDSPHLAYVFYIVPLLSALSAIFLCRMRYRTANLILLVASIFGVSFSVYMYIYLISSKIFKLVNAGAGIHLLFITSIVALIWSFIYCLRKKKTTDHLVSDTTDQSSDAILE